MSARRILDQLLQSGQGLMSGKSGSGLGSLGDLGGLGQMLGQVAQSAKAESKSSSGLLKGAAGGVLGAGALALLLSSKKARKMGGTAARYGGAAALGALAFKAFTAWQAQQATAAAAPATPSPTPIALNPVRVGHQPQTLDRLPAPQAEQHSLAILGAMIGAAKADGHVGEQERQQLEAELARLGGDPGDRRWLEAELAKPLDPAAVAALATSPEVAAEMFLASLIIIDEESFMERAYIDELARRLGLAVELQEALRSQLRQAELA